MLINFEGLDGTGKSTLVKEVLLSVANSLPTKEPGSPLVEVNQQIRNLVLHNKTMGSFERELLFYADAMGHKKMMLNHPETLFLSDRGLWSHVAYAAGCMRLGLLGDDPDENYSRYGLCKKLIKQCCAEPDAVVYLEGSINLMQQRLQGTKDAIESLPTEYFVQVLAAYDDLCIASEFEGKPLLILDAKNSIEQNKKEVLTFIGDLQSQRK